MPSRIEAVSASDLAAPDGGDEELLVIVHPDFLDGIAPLVQARRDQGLTVRVVTPREVYDEPADTFVAGFLGSPPMNVLDAGEVLVGFRPEHLLPVSLVPEPRARVPVRVESRG